MLSGPDGASRHMLSSGSHPGFDFFFPRLQRGAHGGHDRVGNVGVSVDWGSRQNPGWARQSPILGNALLATLRGEIPTPPGEAATKLSPCRRYWRSFKEVQSDAVGTTVFRFRRVLKDFGRPFPREGWPAFRAVSRIKLSENPNDGRLRYCSSAAATLSDS